jgi:diguanylate cyclase (GGDEF)-like protein
MDQADRQQLDLLRSVLETCRGLVAAFGNSGARVCPSLGVDFQHNLLSLAEELSAQVGPAGVGPENVGKENAGPEQAGETGRKLEREVEAWGDRVAEYYRRKADEIREIMLTMAEAARSVSERDLHYKTKFGDVTARLQTIGNIEDLSQIRALVNQSATDLRSCVDRMVADGVLSNARLQAQLTAYQERLFEAERISATDPLTGLANRSGMERELETRIRTARSFCLLVIDLNGFKSVNDTYGHLAGDALLKAFSAEFRAQLRPVDIAGRWGGDEFAAILDCALPEAQALIHRMRKWAFGEYAIPVDGKIRKITVTAAIGLAAWQAGQNLEQIFSAADQAMYADKSAARHPAPSPR